MFNLSRTAIKFLGLVFFGTASHAMWIERIPIDDLCEIKMYEKGDDADIFTALYSPAPCRVSADCKMEVAIKVWHEIPSDEVMDDYRSYISDHLHMLMVRIANMPGKFALVIELTPYRLEQFYEKYSLTHENIINFAEQIATGLASLHEHKIPPQNFNCSTIFVSKSLMLKIADFGLPELGELGEIESTRWEAPEIELMKAQEVIPRRKAQMMGNMYAFGIILYEMKLGHEPLERDEIDPTWPEHFKALLKDLWAEEPSERPTALEVLERFLKDEFQIRKARIAQVPGYKY